jgi:NAD(P)-dependent dehydrogenase (short-subunit alcohol dehydrogenase family)
MLMQGKVAIVAGGGRDIDCACVLELAKNGVNVVITYHLSSATALLAVAEIERFGQQAVAVQASKESSFMSEMLPD